MEKNKISSLQIACLCTFIIVATIPGIGTTNTIQIAGIDAYLGVIVAGILGVIALIIVKIIGDYNHNKNFNEIIDEFFGKYFGFFVKIIVCAVVLTMGIVTMYSICNLVISQFLSTTPMFFISLAMGLVIFYNVSKGLEVMGRVGVILLFFTLLLFTTAVLSLIVQVDVSNLKPMLASGIDEPLWSGVLLSLTSVVPIIMLPIIPRNKVFDKTKLNKKIIIFYALAILMAFLTVFLTIGILGGNLASFYQYPEYTALKKISLFGFLDRVENLISIQWLFRAYMMLCFIVYFLKETVKKESNSKLLIFIFTAIIVVGSVYAFQSNTRFNAFIIKIFPYTNLVLLVIAFILAVLIVIKKGLSSKRT